MRKIVFLVLRLTGISFILRHLVQNNKVTILCYHDPAPDVLEKHILILKKKYNIISLRQYIDTRNGALNVVLPQRSLILTIDDGHRNNYKIKQVLIKYNIPVTIFLCSSIVGTHRHYWWTASISRSEVKQLKRSPDNGRIARLSASGFDEAREHKDRQALSKKEIEDLKMIVDFQSHTKFHPILPFCSSERAIDEISGSKHELEEKYGLGIYAIAYPNGDYSDREVNAVKQAGYDCALTLDGGYNKAHTDLFRLRRIPVYDYADSDELVVKASGMWDFFIKAFGKKGYGYIASHSSAYKKNSVGLSRKGFRREGKGQS